MFLGSLLYTFSFPEVYSFMCAEPVDVAWLEMLARLQFTKCIDIDPLGTHDLRIVLWGHYTPMIYNTPINPEYTHGISWYFATFRTEEAHAEGMSANGWNVKLRQWAKACKALVAQPDIPGIGVTGARHLSTLFS